VQAASQPESLIRNCLSQDPALVIYLRPSAGVRGEGVFLCADTVEVCPNPTPSARSRARALEISSESSPRDLARCFIESGWVQEEAEFPTSTLPPNPEHQTINAKHQTFTMHNNP
jgi:hypothetical protein